MSHEIQNNDAETLSAEENQVRKMLGALKKAETPGDFEFRLKARIANSKPVVSTPNYGWVPKLALPMLGVLAIGAFLMYGSLFSTDVSNLAMNEVPSIEKAVVPAIEVPQESEPAANRPATATNAGQVSPVKSNSSLSVRSDANDTVVKGRSELTEVARKDVDNGGGSIESSVGPPTNSRTPAEFKALPAPSSAIVNQKPTTLTVRDVLSVNGIDVQLEGGKWIVRAVTPNGVGEASGVRRSDVIDAINDQSITEATVFSKSLSGKSITVTRGGSTIRILLRSKQ